MKASAAKVGHRSVDELVKVVRQNFGTQTHGDSFHSLSQQQRELHGQENRLLASAVVAREVLGYFGRKGHVQGKLAQARFNVSGSRRTVSGVDVSPVSLSVNQQVLLTQLHQGIAD